MSQATPHPEQPFEQPWHAAAFALTVHLHERGLFSWTEWADQLADALASDGSAGQLDGGDDYYTAWLAALQTLLDEKGVTGDDQIREMMAAWTAAYLATPHGQPVRLDAAG